MQWNRHTIATPKGFDFAHTLWYLDRGYEDLLVTIDNGVVWKVMPFEASLIPFSVSFCKGQLHYSWRGAMELQASLEKFIVHWLDLEGDLERFYMLAAKVDTMHPLTVAFRGLHMVHINNLFEAACWAILGQQINLTFAHTLKNRLVLNYGRSIVVEGRQLHAFPEPELLLEISDAQFKTMQVSKAKSNYLKNVAEAIVDKKWDLTFLKNIPEFSDQVDYLTKIKGIGEWSANYILLRCVGEGQSVPYGDAGLSNAYQNFFHKKPNRLELQGYLSQFGKYKKYAVLYLWRSLYQ